MDFILEGILSAFNLLLSGDEETYSAIRATLFTSIVSIVCAVIVGFPIGFALGFFEFKGRKILRLFSDTALAMPTVAIGLILYAFITRNGPLGELGLLTASVIENMDKKHRLTVMSYRQNRLNLALTTLYELRYSLLVVIAGAYGRIVAEVGVAMMIGGNIKYFTRTITTAISLETSKGEFSMGIALALVLIAIAFFVNLSIHQLKRLDR